MAGKGLVKNILSLGIVQVANYVFPLISIPVISRIIGPDKFGVLNYAATFIGYFSLLIGYGFDFSATRRIAKDPSNKELRNQVFSEVFFTKIFLFSISLALFIICLQIVPPLIAERKVAIFSFSVCISMVFTQNWLFQAMQDLSKVAFLTFFSKLLFTLIALLIITSKKDYVWQPLVISIIQIFVGVYSFFWAYKRYELTLFYISFKSVKKILWDEKMIFFSLIVISLYTTTNVVILGLVQNQVQVGYYTAAQKLIDVASAVINLPLAQVLFPFIGFAFGISSENGITTVKRIFPIVVVFTSFLALILFLVGPIVLTWFYGHQFVNSVPVFRILAFVPLIISVNNVLCIQIMLNLKMDKPFFWVTVGGAIIGVLLNLVMVKQFGYIGTAWNWMVVEIYITFAAYLYLRFKGINPIDPKEFKPKNIYLQMKPIITGYIHKAN